MLCSAHSERKMNMSEKKNLRDLVFSNDRVTFSRVYPDIDTYAGTLKNNEVNIFIESGKITANSKLNLPETDKKFMEIALDLKKLFSENENVLETELNIYASHELRIVNNVTVRDTNGWDNYDPIFLRVIGLGLFCFAIKVVLEEYTL